MQERKKMSKIVAMILIFTLTFGNFGIVGKYSYAAGLDFFRTTEYDMNAYFAGATGDNKLNVEQDVNDTAKMCIDIGIKGDGYIKDGMLEIAGKDGSSKLSYTVEGVFEEYKAENEENTNTTNTVQNTVANTVSSNEVTNNAVTNEVTNSTVANEITNNTVVNEPISNTVTNEPTNNTVVNVPINNTEANEVKNNVVENGTISNTVTNEVINNTVINETTNNVVNVPLDLSAGKTVNKKSFENNILKLDQINASTKMYLEFKYNNEEYAYSSEGDVLKFTGIYVDKDFKEHTIEKTVDFNINWKSKQDVEITTELTKYIPYTIGEKSGVIVQEKIVVNKENKNNSILIPTNKTTIETNIPTIAGTMPSTVDVVATSIKGTTGKDIAQITDADFKWAYQENTQTVIIETNNDLSDKKAWAGSGYDEYIVTYQYDLNIETVTEENRYIENKIKIDNLLCNGESTFKGISNKAYLTGKVGEIVSWDTESISKEISKGKMLANYNTENVYETEIKSKIEVNVASNELVNQIVLRNTETNFITSADEVLATDSMYYKEIMVTRDNLLSLVGEQGYLEILSEAGESLCKISPTLEPNERGEYVVKFDDEIRKIWMQTTQITGTGVLGINITKGIKTNEYEKGVIKDIKEIEEKVEMYAKYLDKEEAEKISETSIKTKLENTKTESTLELSTKDIPTSNKVENLEMRVELNNNKETSDMYENPTFLMVFPEEIKEVQVNNVGILYGDEFKFKTADQIDLNGQTAIRLEIEGKQNGFNNVNLANGTNIVLNVNLKADTYAPNAQKGIKLYYMNSDVTEYIAQTEMNGGIVGYDEEVINIVSGSGLVNITTLSGYKDEEEEIAIRGEKKVAEVGAYEQEKTAEMKVTLINNEESSVQNVKILGRVPFENNKNISTKEDLGSTFTANMTNGITLDGISSENAKIYYSENEEATEDIANGQNAWTTTVEDFSKVKSYLIQLNNEEIKSKEVMDFKYNIDIPGNLEYDEKTYSTYKLFYTLNGSSLEEGYTSMSIATPEGPNVSIEMTATPGEKAYINDVITYNIVVKNTGTEALNNVNVNALVPEGTVYTELDLAEESVGYKYNEEKKIADFHIDKLEASQEVTFSYMVTVQNEELAGNNIEAYATVVTDEYPNGLNSTVVKLECKKAEFRISTFLPYYNDTIFTGDDEIKYEISVLNISDRELNNIIFTNNVPNEIIYEEANISTMKENFTHSEHENNINYDESNGELKITIDKLEIGEELSVTVKGKIRKKVTESKVTLKSSVFADNTDTYSSSNMSILLGGANIYAEQSTNVETTYVENGQEIEYYAMIENKGNYMSNNLKISTIIPKELEILNTYCYIGNANQEVSQEDVMVVRNNECTKSIVINAKTKVIVKILTKVKENLDNEDEIELNVKTTVEDEIDDSLKVESNEVKHIIKGKKVIEPTPTETANITPTQTPTSTPNVTPTNVPVETPTNTPNVTQTPNPTETPSVTINPQPTATATVKPTNNPNSNVEEKTYKIIGTAWLDEDKDGVKDSNEKLLNGLNVKLVNVQTNNYEKDSNGKEITATTASDGTYILQGIKQGKYIVVFEYDTAQYSVTKYKVSGASEKENSNVATSKVNIDGTEKVVAVSDTIEITNESIGDINIGLVKNSILDFEIEKTVKKITVKTNKQTETYDFNNVSLAKAEIHAKEMDGAQVTIEYEIKIKNVGEVPGTIEDVKDYIPTGTTLVTGSGWTNTNNTAINTSLRNQTILANEEKTLYIQVTKTMNGQNTGVVENKAELGKINVTTSSEAITRNEIKPSSANVIITVKTGIEPMHIILIVLGLLIILGVGIKIYKIKKF